MVKASEVKRTSRKGQNVETDEDAVRVSNTETAAESQEINRKQVEQFHASKKGGK